MSSGKQMNYCSTKLSYQQTGKQNKQYSPTGKYLCGSRYHHRASRQHTESYPGWRECVYSLLHLAAVQPWTACFPVDWLCTSCRRLKSEGKRCCCVQHIQSMNYRVQLGLIMLGNHSWLSSRKVTQIYHRKILVGIQNSTQNTKKETILFQDLFHTIFLLHLHFPYPYHCERWHHTILTNKKVPYLQIMYSPATLQTQVVRVKVFFFSI